MRPVGGIAQNFQETTDYDLAELMEEQGRILEMITSGNELPEILNAIVEWAQRESADQLFASVLLLDEEGVHLLHGAAPSLPAEYNEAIHGLKIGAGVGSCGTAAFTKQKVIVEDIAADPLWKDFKDLALRFGLRACWSAPLVAKDGRVLGTFAMYYKHPKTPSAHDLQIIRLISNTTLLAIESKRAEAQRERLLKMERNAAVKIKKERQQFFELLMKAPAMVCVLRGPDLVFELANTLYREAVGKDRLLIGKPIREALSELRGQGIFELLDGVYQTGEPFYGNEVLVQLRRKEELENRYFNFVYQAIKNENGQPEGIFVHAVDITELVRAKHKAQENEEMFRSFVFNSPTPIGIYRGREMRIQTANEAILKAWEKDASIIGKTLREALPELEGQPFHQLLDDVYTTGVAYHAAEDRVDLMRDGVLSPTYWNFTYKPLRNESGDIYGVLNTATEITELVTAKKKLAEAQEALQSAIEIAELGTWTLHLRDNYISYSEPIARWFGIPPGGSSFDLAFAGVGDEDRQKVQAAVQKAMDTNGLYEAEYKVTHPETGQERLVHARGKITYDENGLPLTLAGVCRDITLQKEIEAKLSTEVEKRTFELQAANKELSALNENLKQFVYIASHDLQEPLRKINMFSDMLRRKTEKYNNPEAEHLMNKIGKAAHRMTNLIKDLLHYSRAESGEKRFAPTDLNAVLRNVIEDYEVMIEQKGARVHVDQLPMLDAIPLQMNQLFYNLIGNALKFSRSSVPPQVAVNCRVMTGDEIAANEKLRPSLPYVEIAVSDNGIGFDQKFAEQIFVIFQRLHQKDEFEGTGIGLALCKKIVENHSGLLFAESSEESGSVFRIVLPVVHRLS